MNSSRFRRPTTAKYIFHRVSGASRGMEDDTPSRPWSGISQGKAHYRVRVRVIRDKGVALSVWVLWLYLRLASWEQCVRLGYYKVGTQDGEYLSSDVNTLWRGGLEKTEEGMIKNAFTFATGVRNEGGYCRCSFENSWMKSSW